MKKETGIKYVVKVLSITKPLQKIHFTVRHPEEALYLTGIAVTATNFLKRDIEGTISSDVTGVMSLAIPEEGDVFYSQEIKLETGNFSEYPEQGLGQRYLKRDFGFSAKRYDFFNTCLKITDASIEGYYENAASSRFSGASPKFAIPEGRASARPDIKTYKVTLYLRYQMKEGKQT